MKARVKQRAGVYGQAEALAECYSIMQTTEIVEAFIADYRQRKPQV